MRIASETELAPPVKAFLEALDYEVRSEVHDCDLVAVRGDEMLVVELKRSLNLTLVLQGIDRQRVADAVYLAIESPKRWGTRKKRSQVLNLCRRLGLGLITVAFTRARPRVEVLLDPEPSRPARSSKPRINLRREFERRSDDFNIAGSTRRPIVTAYREEALHIAAVLQRLETATVAELRSACENPRAGSVLQKNYYGWFSRVQRGVYRLTEQGEQALATYKDVVQTWENDLE